MGYITAKVQAKADIEREKKRIEEIFKSAKLILDAMESYLLLNGVYKAGI